MPIRRRLCHPATLAVLACIVNGAKPAVVDDTAYLAFARQIAAHPLDPFGFELFWYRVPEPAMHVLAPPVVTYWLGAGVALFGESVPLLKLWLLPFVLALAYSVRSLLRRFAGAESEFILPAIILGPGVLPFVNLMLDVPALALQMSAVAVFLAATDGPTCWRRVFLAEILVGLAMQTKYSSLTLPVVIVGIGVVRRSVVPTLVVVIGAASLFAVVELLFAAKYGESHFLFHLRDASKDGLAESLRDKGALVIPMFCYLGVTAGWIGLLGCAAMGDGPRCSVAIRILAACVGVGFLVVLIVPGRYTALTPHFTLAQGFFDYVGIFTALIAAILVRHPPPGTRPALLTLGGWLTIEVLGYFAMTPFPAGRRVLGITVILALIVAVAWVKSQRRVRWPITTAIVLGFLFAGIDIWDAQVEPAVAREAIRIGRSEPGNGYFVGHWGWQYECEKGGLKPYLPGQTQLGPGDWVLVPVDPDPAGFDRPDPGGVEFDPAKENATRTAEVWWDDWLAAETLPALYGGRCPVRSRDHPRLRVGVWRVR